MKNVKIFSFVTVFILTAIAIIFALSLKTLAPVGTDTIKETPKEELKLNVKDEDLEKLTKDQKALYEKLLEAAKKEDYENFAKILKEVYKNQWEGLAPLQGVESALYVLATDKYFTTGNYNESLRVSTIIYNELPMGWRFRYLKIVSHEKLGRTAFEKNDLAEAEKQAMAILSMMYRIEGANLLADVYIKKISEALAKKDKKLVQENLDYIWDYEVSQDRRNTLINLKSQVANLK